MSRWKIASQKSILRTKLLHVKQVVFENQKGTKKSHYNAERSTVVSIFPLTDRDEIYLVSQYRYLLDKTVLEAVSGYVEKDERIISAAARELKEETGMAAQQLEELARVDLAGSVFKGKVHLFLAKGLEIGDNDLDEDEEIEVIKMPLEKAVEKVMTGEINHAGSMIGILMLDKLRREKKL